MHFHWCTAIKTTFPLPSKTSIHPPPPLYSFLPSKYKKGRDSSSLFFCVECTFFSSKKVFLGKSFMCIFFRFLDPLPLFLLSKLWRILAFLLGGKYVDWSGGRGSHIFLGGTFIIASATTTITISEGEKNVFKRFIPNCIHSTLTTSSIHPFHATQPMLYLTFFLFNGHFTLNKTRVKVYQDIFLKRMDGGSFQCKKHAFKMGDCGGVECRWMWIECEENKIKTLSWGNM